MALNQTEIEKIINDRTFFDVSINLLDGELESDVTNLKFDDYLKVKFNEKVIKRIRDFLPRVLNQRGITAPDEIDVNHPNVQSKIKQLRKQKGRNTRIVNEDETIAIVSMVRNAHQPQYIMALMQVVLWAIVYDDLFTVTKASVDTKFDLTVKDEYWDGTVVDDGDAALYELVGDTWTIDFKKFDKNNPLEHMIALASTLFDTFPEIAPTLGKLQSNVLYNFTFGRGGVDFDDATFLSAELDAVLYKPVLRANNSEQRG